VVIGLDTGGFQVVRWRPQEAFFSYSRSPNAPTPPPARAEADPKETARAWLQEIGFDLTTIQYDSDLRADSTPSQRIVEFRPTNLPKGALDPGLGIVVWVGGDGAIRQASGFWLSLVESAEVPLQPVETAWQAVQRGEGLIPSFGPPPVFKAITVKSVGLTYLLTRADASNYLLQPVVAFSGQGQTAAGPGDVTVYVAAAAR
jgi:hypothetical protein